MKMPVPTSGEGFERCPAGNHLAVCYEIIDLGTQEATYKGETKKQRKIWLGWETPHEQMEDGRPFVIGRRYTLSSHEKSTLRKDLESWRGKPFKDEEFGEGGFAIESVIGAACFLNVVHNENEGKTYANINSVAALPKGTKAPSATNSHVYFSLDPPDFSQDTFDSLSDRMKETIAKSPEFQQVKGAGPVTVPAIDESDDNESPF